MDRYRSGTVVDRYGSGIAVDSGQCSIVADRYGNGIAGPAVSRGLASYTPAAGRCAVRATGGPVQRRSSVKSGVWRVKCGV